MQDPRNDVRRNAAIEKAKADPALRPQIEKIEERVKRELAEEAAKQAAQPKMGILCGGTTWTQALYYALLEEGLVDKV